MNAQLNPYRDADRVAANRDEHDEAFTRLVESIRNDRMQILSLDDSETQGLNFDDFIGIFTALADVGGKRGLLDRLADRIELVNGDGPDFATLCRLADMCAAKREAAIMREAEEQQDAEEVGGEEDWFV